VKQLNPRLRTWDDSALLQLFRSENMRRPENINFGIGEMDFATPSPVVEACKDALDRGITFYMPTAGAPDLRQALAESCSKEYESVFKEDEIFITPGGTNAIFVAILALVGPGEEVLYPNPGFPAYFPQIALASAVPVDYPLTKENGFAPDPDDIRKRITQKTKILILNSPSNPIGNIVPADRLEAIAKLAMDYDLWVISDEAYKHLVYKPDNHKSIIDLAGMKQRTLIACSFSKTYAMTGWRMGYIIAPSMFNEPFFKVFQYTVTGVSSFSQIASAKAVREGGTYASDILSRMAHRKEMIEKGLSEIPHVYFPKPQGAFYVFLNIEQTGLTSMEISKRLLDDFSIVTIPGSAFGSLGEGFLRLSYAVGEEKISEGIERLKKAMAELIRR
jgi:aspartate/methionine/tyrosine aminotransferase